MRRVNFQTGDGKYDPIVSVRQAELMDEALSETIVDYSVTYFNYEGHGFRFKHNIMRYLAESEELFAENLLIPEELLLGCVGWRFSEIFAFM